MGSINYILKIILEKKPRVENRNITMKNHTNFKTI